MAKRTRRTKAEIEQSKGLGDTIEKITTATGIKAIVKFIAGDDCNCDKRKEFLNKVFPYKKPNCLDELEYDYLSNFFSKHIENLLPTQQTELLAIYNRVFNAKQESTSCSDCWRTMIKELKQVYEQY